MKKFNWPKEGIDWVYMIRNLIYLLAIVFFFGSIVVHYMNADEPMGDRMRSFFPPDLVPHPMPPWDDPRERPDESKGTLCNEERERGPQERD